MSDEKISLSGPDPFFCTGQYDFGLAYIGHAERWDKSEMEGSLDQRDRTITYSRGNRKLAAAVIHRDLQGLRAEVQLERAAAARPPADSSRP